MDVGYIAALNKAIDEQMDHDPLARPTYEQCRRMLTRRQFDPEYRSVLMQTGRNPGIHDAAFFARMHSFVVLGLILVCCLDVGQEPGRDSDREGNQAKLDALLPEYEAIVDPQQGQDGCVEWKRALPFRSWPMDGGPWKDLNICKELPAGRYLPLEIGYTRPQTTFWHLFHECGVARWPYGSTHLWLLHWTGPSRSELLAEAMRKGRSQ